MSISRKIVGVHGISANVLAHSISPSGVELLTFELEYPRLILAELNTHRMLSRNSASSRAIPFSKMMEQLTARPVRFGQANPGMQDKGVDFYALVGKFYGHDGWPPEECWEAAKSQSVHWAEAFYKAGYHKQVYNRLLEPWQMMKTVMSGTEWNNFFWLRDDDASDPTIRELARVMLLAKQQSRPVEIRDGEWHLPYVGVAWQSSGKKYFIEDSSGYPIYLPVEDAIKVSCARCAAVSFRNVDYGVEKSREVYARLVGDERKHASALEHQATPVRQMQDGDMWLNIPEKPMTWQHGVSHIDKKGQLWSGNFRGWVQHRKTVSGENVEG